MKIWIDADAAPREVKEMVFRTSLRLKVSVVLVANQSLWTPPSNPLITSVAVSDGANVADTYIVEHSYSGDVAITADIPLAAKLVSKQVFVIDPRGEEYADHNIAGRLAARDFFDAGRAAGKDFKGPAPYGKKQMTAFALALDRVLTRSIKLLSEIEKKN